MKKIYCFLLVTTLVCTANYSRAQVSIMEEISNIFLEKLIATAKENYPRVDAFKSRITIAKSAVISQKSSWLDGVSFSYIYKPNNTLDIVNPTFFNGYQVGVSFSINSLFQKASNVKQAKETVKIAQFDQAEYNLTLETQVKTRYYTFIQQKNALALQYKIYADAQSMNKDISNKYSKGEVTFTEFIQAQTFSNSAMQARQASETAYLIAKAALEELTVKKIEEIQ